MVDAHRREFVVTKIRLVVCRSQNHRAICRRKRFAPGNGRKRAYSTPLDPHRRRDY